MTRSGKQFPDVLDARTCAVKGTASSGARDVVGGHGASLVHADQGLARGLPVESMVTERGGVSDSRSSSSR